MLNYSSSGKTCNKDTTLLKDAGLRFLNSDNSLLRKKWFSSFSRTSVKATQGKLVLIYDASENPINFSPDQLPLELRNSFISYRKIYSKKPLLAASFSAVIPGLGKLYAGKKKSALAAFLLNAGYAVQTVESINKLGVTHPFTIVNMCAFTVFYMSNIYGAYRSVIELRSERKKQFLVDATYFYN